MKDKTFPFSLAYNLKHLQTSLIVLWICTGDNLDTRSPLAILIISSIELTIKYIKRDECLTILKSFPFSVEKDYEDLFELGLIGMLRAF